MKRSIGELISGGWRVTAYCRDCGRRGRIDLVATADRHGLDVTIGDITLRCECGSSRVTHSEQRYPEGAPFGNPVGSIIEEVLRPKPVPRPEGSKSGQYP